ncbi:hypothetical protein ACT01_08780 [Megasphaera hexanoica]|nr:hypothetical protein ACT01_08780 [Megasphaera hexanoica]
MFVARPLCQIAIYVSDARTKSHGVSGIPYPADAQYAVPVCEDAKNTAARYAIILGVIFVRKKRIIGRKNNGEKFILVPDWTSIFANPVSLVFLTVCIWQD